VYGLPAAVVGTMFLITRVWDSLFDPIVGVIADRTQTKWGKFRPYLLFTAVPFGLIGVLTFTTPDFGYTGKLVYAYIMYSLMMMVYSLINVPYASLLGVMSAQPAERNILSTYRMAFAYLGSFVALLLIEPLVEFFSKSTGDAVPNLQFGWQMGVGVIAIICITLFLLGFAWTKERVKPLKEDKTPLKTDLRDLFKNGPWWILLGAGIAALIFNSIRDGATVYYFKYFIQDVEAFKIGPMGTTITLTSLYLVLGQAANIVGVVLAAPVSNLIGKKNTYLAAMVLATILSVIFFWFGEANLVSI
jgi:glycoside/pentoside/hexuronide:cation symporter, GPH family